MHPGAAAVALAVVLACGGEPSASGCRPPTLVLHVVETWAPHLSTSQRHELVTSLVEAGRRHELDPLLIATVIRRESGFRPHAVGPRGSLGLMQVQPRTAGATAARHEIPYSGRQQLFDIGTNVRLGVAYLAELEAELGSWSLALGAYNMGPGRVRWHLDRGRTPELFAAPILAEYRQLCDRLGVELQPWTEPWR